MRSKSILVRPLFSSVLIIPARQLPFRRWLFGILGSVDGMRNGKEKPLPRKDQALPLTVVTRYQYRFQTQICCGEICTFVMFVRPKRAEEPRTYASRSEERRVGKECRSRWSPY